MEIGIVGLPNVGKSTLFNALLKKQQALVANYPFATIEPNVGIVPVPDARLEEIRKVVEKSENVSNVPIIPATVKFVDIAGLVKGAAQGAGLGNQFLSHIREVDLICHVVRDFPDPDIIREGSTDPKSDMEIVNTELILADLQTLEKSQSSKVKSENYNLKFKSPAVEKLKTELNKGKLAKDVELTDEEKEAVSDLQLLTFKPVLYVINGTYGPAVNREPDSAVNSITIDAKTEAELVILSPEEQVEYLKELGKTESGLDRLIRKAYEMLGLISYFTAGEKEVRAWTIKEGTKAPEAAGVIHTDFIKGFIRAEVIAYEDYLRYNGKKGSADAGKMRLEGKEYEVKDGDVIEFRVNV